ncbi:MAG: hypothetical protein HC905_04825 [Bacteroidales bacterium]|nr:hypothetical protein [Bacteroidales bacterium]
MTGYKALATNFGGAWFVRFEACTLQRRDGSVGVPLNYPLLYPYRKGINEGRKDFNPQRKAFDLKRKHFNAPRKGFDGNLRAIDEGKSDFN